jgi:hypothetical protein
MVGSAVIRAPASSPPLGLKAEPALGRRRHTNPADRQPLYAHLHAADGRRRDFARCADYANACSRRRAGRRCLELCIGEEASILLATVTRNVMAEMIRRSQHGHGAERRGRSGAVEQPRGGELAQQWRDLADEAVSENEGPTQSNLPTHRRRGARRTDGTIIDSQHFEALRPPTIATELLAAKEVNIPVTIEF